MPPAFSRIAALAFCLLATLPAPLAAAVELRIGYGALERILAAEVFTQDGRRYVRGTPKNRCDYAFLEHPQVTARGGRMFLRARFSGRSARNWFGKCVGLGDDFDVAIAALPYYRDGVIALREVKVESPGRDGFYIRRVRAALADSLAKEFRYRVADDIRRIFEQPRDKAPYRQQLTRFQFYGIRAADDALELQLDFTLAVQ